MATKKSAGSTSLGRDSQPKYLGVKIADGEVAGIGNVIVRQRGTRIYPGKNVKRGKDDTILAMKEGKVSFTTSKVRRYNGKLLPRTFVHVI